MYLRAESHNKVATITLLSKLCKQIYFEPCLDHSLVPTVFNLETYMCFKDPINKTCRKNGKDLSNGAPNIKLWNHTKKTHFPVFAKNFHRPCMKLKIFFCQFPNPWTLKVSGMGGYTSKCEKSQNHCTLMWMLRKILSLLKNYILTLSKYITVSPRADLEIINS